VCAYAVEGEVVRIAAGEVEVLPIELEAISLNRHKSGRGYAGGRCSAYGAGRKMAEQGDTEEMQHHLHHSLSSTESSVKLCFDSSRGREIYIACVRT